jgi:hypothetical protein
MYQFRHHHTSAHYGYTVSKWRRRLNRGTLKRLAVLLLVATTLMTSYEEGIQVSLGECLSHDRERVRKYFRQWLLAVDAGSTTVVDGATATSLQRCRDWKLHEIGASLTPADGLPAAAATRILAYTVADLDNERHRGKGEELIASPGRGKAVGKTKAQPKPSSAKVKIHSRKRHRRDKDTRKHVKVKGKSANLGGSRWSPEGLHGSVAPETKKSKSIHGRLTRNHTTESSAKSIAHKQEVPGLITSFEKYTIEELLSMASKKMPQSEQADLVDELTEMLQSADLDHLVESGKIVADSTHPATQQAQRSVIEKRLQQIEERIRKNNRVPDIWQSTLCAVVPLSPPPRNHSGGDDWDIQLLLNTNFSGQTSSMLNYCDHKNRKAAPLPLDTLNFQLRDQRVFEGGEVGIITQGLWIHLDGDSVMHDTYYDLIEAIDDVSTATCIGKHVGAGLTSHWKELDLIITVGGADPSKHTRCSQPAWSHGHGVPWSAKKVPDVWVWSAGVNFQATTDTTKQFKKRLRCITSQLPTGTKGIFRAATPLPTTAHAEEQLHQRQNTVAAKMLTNFEFLDAWTILHTHPKFDDLIRQDSLSLYRISSVASKWLTNQLVQTLYSHKVAMVAASPRVPERRVIAYSMYGDNERYTDGALANAKLYRQIYPGWKMRVYHDETVPARILNAMKAEGVDLVNMGSSTMNRMSWRFQAAVDADRFCSRDIDSRLSMREKAAVDEWIYSGKQFHVMRDHPSHSTNTISGGMWCSRKLPNLMKEFEDLSDQEYMADMNFLSSVIWPMARGNTIQHDAFSCESFGGGRPFPLPRVKWEHVGSVFVDGKMRDGDVDILADNILSDRARRPCQCLAKEVCPSVTQVWDPLSGCGCLETELWNPDAKECIGPALVADFCTRNMQPASWCPPPETIPDYASGAAGHTDAGNEDPEEQEPETEQEQEKVAEKKQKTDEEEEEEAEEEEEEEVVV